MLQRQKLVLQKQTQIKGETLQQLHVTAIDYEQCKTKAARPKGANRSCSTTFLFHLTPPRKHVVFFVPTKQLDGAAFGSGVWQMCVCSCRLGKTARKPGEGNADQTLHTHPECAHEALSNVRAQLRGSVLFKVHICSAFFSLIINNEMIPLFEPPSQKRWFYSSCFISSKSFERLTFQTPLRSLSAWYFFSHCPVSRVERRGRLNTLNLPQIITPMVSFIQRSVRTFVMQMFLSKIKPSQTCEMLPGNVKNRLWRGQEVWRV